MIDSIVKAENKLFRDYLSIMETRDYKYATFLEKSKRSDWAIKSFVKRRKNFTESERKVACFLITRHIRFVYQRPFIINDRIYFSDFFIPKDNVIIEVDGYEHTDSLNDSIRDYDFSTICIKTIRIPNAKTWDTEYLTKSIGFLRPTLEDVRQFYSKTGPMEEFDGDISSDVKVEKSGTTKYLIPMNRFKEGRLYPLNKNDVRQELCAILRQCTPGSSVLIEFRSHYWFLAACEQYGRKSVASRHNLNLAVSYSGNLKALGKTNKKFLKECKSKVASMCSPDYFITDRRYDE